MFQGVIHPRWWPMHPPIRSFLWIGDDLIPFFEYLWYPHLKEHKLRDISRNNISQATLTSLDFFLRLKATLTILTNTHYQNRQRNEYIIKTEAMWVIVAFQSQYSRVAYVIIMRWSPLDVEVVAFLSVIASAAATTAAAVDFSFAVMGFSRNRFANAMKNLVWSWRLVGRALQDWVSRVKVSQGRRLSFWNYMGTKEAFLGVVWSLCDELKGGLKRELSERET